jgi:LPS export ABC transporter protein LptC
VGALAWVVLAIVALSLGAWWYGSGWVTVAARPGEDRRERNRVVMKHVQIEVFDENFNQTALLKGETATTFKDSSDIILEPVEGTILREDGRDILVKAARCQKVVNAMIEKLIFTGDVDVTTEGRKLRSELLYYTPATHMLESGAPVQVLTTGSLILAQSLKSQTDLKSGVLEGDVQITTLGEGQRALDAPIRISGKKSDFDFSRSLYDVVGAAWAKKTDQDVQADKIVFNRRRGTLTAIGNSVARRPNLTVRAGHLEYWIDREVGVATQGPKAVQITAPTTSEDETQTELTARVLEVDFRRQVLEGRDDVRLQRSVRFEGEWDPDYRVNARAVTSLYSHGRSTFRDDVRIEGAKVGAVGDRAIFYQRSAKLYIVGRAQAWDYDEEKVRQNHLAGEKIVHDMRTGKSVVLDRVKMRSPGAPSRPRAGVGRGARAADEGRGATDLGLGLGAPPRRVNLVIEEPSERNEPAARDREE